MKKSTIITIVVIVVLLFIIFGMYNGLVKKQEAVEAQWAQVENVYQRRYDLIPNIVNAVKGYSEHEQSTLVEVMDARAKATSINIDPSKATPEQFAQFQEVQDQLTGAVSRLLVTVERYPDLKASEQFSELIVELEGSENRIANERKKFNEKAQEYNQSIRLFPHNIIASIFGFEKIAYFKAKDGADTAPVVDFSK